MRRKIHFQRVDLRLVFGNMSTFTEAIKLIWILLLFVWKVCFSPQILKAVCGQLIWVMSAKSPGGGGGGGTNSIYTVTDLTAAQEPTQWGGKWCVCVSVCGLSHAPFWWWRISVQHRPIICPYWAVRDCCRMILLVNSCSLKCHIYECEPHLSIFQTISRSSQRMKKSATYRSRRY